MSEPIDSYVAPPTNSEKRRFMKYALKCKLTNHSDFVTFVNLEIATSWVPDEQLSFYRGMQLYFAETANFARYTNTLKTSQSEEVLAKNVHRRKAVGRGLNPSQLVSMVAAHIDDFTATEDLITQMQVSEWLPETHLGAMEYNSAIQGRLNSLHRVVMLMRKRVDEVQSLISEVQAVASAERSVRGLLVRYPVCTEETASQNPYNDSVDREYEFVYPQRNRLLLVSHWTLLSQ